MKKSHKIIYVCNKWCTMVQKYAIDAKMIEQRVDSECSHQNCVERKIRRQLNRNLTCRKKTVPNKTQRVSTNWIYLNSRVKMKSLRKTPAKIQISNHVTKLARCGATVHHMNISWAPQLQNFIMWHKSSVLN